MKQAPQVSDGFRILLVGILIGALGMAFWFAVGNLVKVILKWL